MLCQTLTRLVGTKIFHYQTPCQDQGHFSHVLQRRILGIQNLWQAISSHPWISFGSYHYLQVQTFTSTMLIYHHVLRPIQLKFGMVPLLTTWLQALSVQNVNHSFMPQNRPHTFVYFKSKGRLELKLVSLFYMQLVIAFTYSSPCHQRRPQFTAQAQWHCK